MTQPRAKECSYRGTSKWGGRLVFVGPAVVMILIGVKRSDSQFIVTGIGMAILGAIVLYFNERSGVFVDHQGFTSVPVSGRPRSLLWSSIDEFSTGPRYPGQYMVFAAVGNKLIWLDPTRAWGRAEPEKIAAALNADLARWRQSQTTHTA